MSNCQRVCQTVKILQLKYRNYSVITLYVVNPSYMMSQFVWVSSQNNCFLRLGRAIQPFLVLLLLEK